MRKIKFRAWSKKQERFVYGSDYVMILAQDGKLDICETLYWDMDFSDINDDIVLSQYTGMKDKNGKEIYEGDVIETEKMEYSDSGHYIGTVKVLGKVVFNNGRYALHLETGAMPDLSFALSFHEIIGNVWEHHHLLKGDENE